MNRKSLIRSVGSATGLLVVFGILAALHVIAQKASIRTDLTEDHLFTLSSGTKQLLGSMERDVTLKLYFSRSAENLPVGLKQYAERVTDLLREYETHSKGRVLVEVLDPKPDSDEEEWAQRYGLTGQGMNLLGGGSTVYFGLVALSGSREAVIPFIAPNAEPQIEYLVTRLVNEVLQTKRPKIGVMSALPIVGEPPNPFAQSGGQEPWVIVSELKKQYEVIPVATEIPEIPADVDTLLLVHPQALSDQTQFAIDQFVLRGGRLLAFVDPLCLAQQEIDGQPMQSFTQNSSDLNKLTRAWGGIELASDGIVSDIENATQISRGQGKVERSPLWLSLRNDRINRDDVGTSHLKILMVPFSGAFRVASTNENVTVTPLVKSSADSTFASLMEVMNPNLPAGRSRGEGEQMLALRLQGHFKTAFPDGKPRVPETKEGEQAADSGKPALKESRQPCVVVLVADVDLLFNRFCVNAMQFLGQTFYEPINDNLNFVLNTIEQISGNAALIGLRSRGTFDRPFERVLNMERDAQKRWQQEELSLTAKLQETQARLRELESVKSKDQQYILSPEQKAEIEKFRNEQFQTQQQLKQVRKNLRRDIEVLGLKIKVLNIALMPALVAVFGLFRGWHRRKQAAS